MNKKLKQVINEALPEENKIMINEYTLSFIAYLIFIAFLMIEFNCWFVLLLFIWKGK